MLTQALDRYIDKLAEDLSRLHNTDPTVKVKRHTVEYSDCVSYGVQVFILGGKANVEWAVEDNYITPGTTELAWRKSRITKLRGEAFSHYVLDHDGDQELRKAGVNFAKQFDYDVASDFKNFLEFNRHRRLNPLQPASNFAEHVSIYAHALHHVRHLNVARLVVSSPLLTPEEKAMILGRIPVQEREKPNLNLGLVQYNEVKGTSKHVTELGDVLVQYMTSGELVPLLSQMLTNSILRNGFQNSPENARQILRDLSLQLKGEGI